MSETQAAMPQEQSRVAQEQARMAQPNPLDTIIENTEARKQAEAAKGDYLAGQIYGPAMNIGAEVAALKIAYGRDFGFSPAMSLKCIHIIHGSPSLAADGRSNLLVKAGYSWKAIKHDETEATFRFYRNGEGLTQEDGKPLVMSFTMKDADRAGYVEQSRGKGAKPGDKGNYDKVPKNMLWARLISNFHRWYAPEVDGSYMLDPGEILDAAIENTVVTKSNDKLAVLEQQLEEVRVAVAE